MAASGPGRGRRGEQVARRVCQGREMAPWMLPGGHVTTHLPKPVAWTLSETLSQPRDRGRRGSALARCTSCSDAGVHDGRLQGEDV